MVSVTPIRYIAPPAEGKSVRAPPQDPLTKAFEFRVEGRGAGAAPKRGVAPAVQDVMRSYHGSAGGAAANSTSQPLTAAEQGAARSNCVAVARRRRICAAAAADATREHDQCCDVTAAAA